MMFIYVCSRLPVDQVRYAGLQQMIVYLDRNAAIVPCRTVLVGPLYTILYNQFSNQSLLLYSIVRTQLGQYGNGMT